MTKILLHNKGSNFSTMSNEGPLDCLKIYKDSLNLTNEQKLSILGSVAVSSSTLDYDESNVTDWSFVILSELVKFLELSQNEVTSFRALVPTTYITSRIEWEDKKCMIFPFLLQVNESSLKGSKLIIFLAAFFLSINMYNSNARVLLRNLKTHLSISNSEFIALEYNLTKAIQNFTESNLSHTMDKPKSNKWRYAKIGAASIGAGAVLALTGGLAAPAIFAAAAVMSGTTAATASLATVLTVGGIFGTAGAGLTGYKMTRRTQGLQEFAFEKCGENSQQEGLSSQSSSKLSVVIMVSGWMQNHDDDKRTYGFLPSNEHLSLYERLSRYYKRICLDTSDTGVRNAAETKLLNVKEEVKIWGKYVKSKKNALEVLYHDLNKIFHLDPKDATNLVAPKRSPNLLHQNLQSFLTTSVNTLIFKYDINSHGSIQNDKTDEDTTTENENDFVDVNLSSPYRSLKLTRKNSSSKTSSTEDDDNEINSSTPPAAAASAAAAASEQDEENEFKKSDMLKFSHWDWAELEESANFEVYLLRWETDLQIELGNSILSLLKSLGDAIAGQIIATTMLAALATAVILPVSLLKFTDMIDGTWTIAVERADQAGEELAKALLSRPQGNRAVTLVGNSMGARIIIKAVLILHTLREEMREEVEGESASVSCEKGSKSSKKSSWFSSSSSSSSSKKETSSKKKLKYNIEIPPNFKLQDFDDLIQDVVVLGAPSTIRENKWTKIRSIVRGRLVNGYSEKDLVLSFVYRYERWKIQVAGVSPVPVPGIENINLSHIIEKHTDYCVKMKEVLSAVDLSSPVDFTVL